MNCSEIHEAIRPQKEKLLSHPLYQNIRNVADLRLFLENHVYAVWDFMSLLKALQQKLTCTSIPWFATEDAGTRYLINEIVLAEESDVALDGSRKSHFEMYLGAMKACGADTAEVENFIADVFSLHNIFVAIKQSPLHPQVKSFLDFTFRIIEEGKPHCIAAAFTFGREDLIPQMFTAMLKEFQLQLPETDLAELVYYFERHIELDADEHGPMAMSMISALCADDANKWREVQETSILALQKRIGLWDAIQEQILVKPELA